MRRTWIVTLLLASGCGDLSNDDLVFLAGVPRAEEIAVGLEPEGSNPNALTGLLGEPAEYYENATEIAGGFDTIVGTSIDFVEKLGWGYAPTHRTETTRIWGPVHNVDRSGVTVRLEIRRDVRDAGEPFYTFCLHAGPDATAGFASPSCETPAAGGLRLLVWGSFVPRAGDENGRAGRGDIHIDFEALRALDMAGDGRGVLSIGYDFTGGGTARALHIEWVRIISLTGLSTERFEYDFADDGAGNLGFNFVYEGDIYADTGVVGFTDNETVAVEACWSETGPGRADVSFKDGDLLFGQTGTSRECWDPHHDRTYWYLGVGSTMIEEEGDDTVCPSACAL